MRSNPAPLVWSLANHAGGRGQLAEEVVMGSDEVQGLTVRVRDGRTLGVVVGVFTEGPLAGRLRVHGAYACSGYRAGPQDGIAVYAIPRQAVVRQRHESLVLDTTLSTARSRWLMHVALMTGA
jgi:hypothetical protein